MILKRVVKENIIKCLYDSSNILGSKFDTSNNDLILIFKGGAQYKYPNVTNTDYTRFETADSQGVTFNTHIKKYSFEKLENIDISKLIVEADNLKVAEQEVLILGKLTEIIKLVKPLTAIDTDKIDSSGINELKNIPWDKLLDKISSFRDDVNKLKEFNG